MSGSVARERALEIADQLAPLGPMTVERLFGGAVLKADGRAFAFVADGTLYLRVDAETRDVFTARGSVPFGYPTRKGRVETRSYFEAPSELFDDPDLLRAWAREAIAAAERAAVRAPRGRRRMPPVG